jgi:hypothetical protein
LGDRLRRHRKACACDRAANDASEDHNTNQRRILVVLSFGAVPANNVARTATSKKLIGMALLGDDTVAFCGKESRFFYARAERRVAVTSSGLNFSAGGVIRGSDPTANENRA